MVSAPCSGAEALRDWPNPATLLERSERELEALQRAEEEVLAIQELYRSASDDPFAAPGPVGSASVLEHLHHARRVAGAWADTAAATVQRAMSTTPAASRDRGSAAGG